MRASTDPSCAGACRRASRLNAAPAFLLCRKAGSRTLSAGTQSGSSGGACGWMDGAGFVGMKPQISCSSVGQESCAGLLGSRAGLFWSPQGVAGGRVSLLLLPLENPQIGTFSSVVTGLGGASNGTLCAFLLLLKGVASIRIILAGLYKRILTGFSITD